MTNNPYSEKLFSYGTLQYESVQKSTFGRILKGTPDSILGFEKRMIAIHDAAVVSASGDEFHPIVAYTGNNDDSITGTVLEITLEELKQADEYEVDDYQRVKVQTSSGLTAWIYVDKSKMT